MKWINTHFLPLSLAQMSHNSSAFEFQYQFWCDEASATIVRVGKYSSQCKTREAVSILYKQFEKFVWPTVPQQEERISQITELAVRLHGKGPDHTQQTTILILERIFWVWVIFLGGKEMDAEQKCCFKM